MPRKRVWLLAVLFAIAVLPAFSEQQKQKNDSPLRMAQPERRFEPPPPDASAAELEKRGDELREGKANWDAIDYYRAALAKKQGAVLHNKIGIAQLQLMRLKDAKKSFQRAIKMDRNYAEAYNNLGVVYYFQKKFKQAIKEYRRALALSENASFHSNLGNAYFERREFAPAIQEYALALQLDPNIFEKISKSGVILQMHSPEDQAMFSYVMAKIYAQAGQFERSLLYLKRAMEEGYKKIDTVYEEPEFAGLRQDPRFTDLMKNRPESIPQ